MSRDQRVQEYLDVVCAQIRYREIHPQIVVELESHIDDIVAAEEQSGTSPEDAVARAIRQMGDALVLGKQLDRTHKPRIEWSLLVLSGLFVTIGLIIQYCMQAQGLLPQANHFRQHLPFALAGLGICLLFMLFVDYYKLKRFSWHIYWATLAIWLTTIVFGSAYGGRSMLNLGFALIDFPSLAPFLLAFALAGIFADWRWEGWMSRIKTVMLLLLPTILGLITPAASSVIIYAVLFLVLMGISGTGWKRTTLFASCLVLTFTGSLFSVPYRLGRVLAFLHPYSDPRAEGWLYVQILDKVHAAGMWGRGFTLPNKSVPMIDYELVFTYLIYTFGIVAAFVFVAFALLFVYRLFRAARQVKDPYGSLLITGFATLIGIQFVWNMLMATGKAPLFSLGLPFVSPGIAPLMIQLLALGMVLSAFRRKDLEREI